MERKITLTKTIVFALTLFIGSFAFAQDRTCGMLEYMEEQMKDPEFAKEYERTQAKFKAELQRSLANEKFSQRGGSTIIIPVAVHYPQANEADRDCLEALAQNQIDILNADYTATNADFAQWNGAMGSYPGTTAGSANIEFCIAVSNHPPGLDPELLEGNPAITIGYNFGGGGNQDAAWAGYMNFVVRNIGALGFSPKPGSIAAGQAVTMDNNAFGSGAGCGSGASGVNPSAPYNLGRTVTHELGHFYNLNHPWGPGGATCAADDGIADTPNTGVETFGCPSAGSLQACIATENILSMNYMDYVNDACMYMFTEDQVTLMEVYLNSVQSDFVVGVCTPAGPGFSVSGADAATCGDEAVFRLTYNQTGGFSETTTFTASGNPGGSTISVFPTTLSSNGNFDVSLSGLSGITTGDYTITVTATSTSITENYDFTLSITDEACDSSGNTTFGTATQGVSFGDISTSNTGKTTGYDDYTATESTDVVQSQSYNLIVNVDTDGNFPVQTRVWIDWNQNCSFDDEGEEYDLGQTVNTPNGTTGNSPASIMVPADAAVGNTTMRVATKYVNGDDPGLPMPCLDAYDGETEDYRLVVMASLSVEDNVFDNFAIFPNPNEGEFTVKLNSNSGNAIAIDVHDIRGRRIFNNSYVNGSDFNQTVKLNNVQSGLYLVTVKDGDRQITKKIVVE